MLSLALTVYKCTYHVVPEIKVYQPSNKDAFCLGVQIRKLVMGQYLGVESYQLVLQDLGGVCC